MPNTPPSVASQGGQPDTVIPPTLQPLHTKIIGRESGGKDILYGPGNRPVPPGNVIPGAIGPTGQQTHAFNAEQWEPATWNEANEAHLAQGLGPLDHTNRRDNEWAWLYISRKRYNDATHNLDADAAAGKIDEQRLAGTWPTLGPKGNYGAMIDAARAAGEQAHGERQKLIDSEISALGELQKQIGALSPHSEERHQLVAQQLERSQKLQDSLLEMARNPPQQKPTDLMSTFGSLAMLVAAIGGSRSRQPATASLNAAAGVIEGVNSNNKEEFERNLAVWKAQTGALRDVLGFQNDTFREIMENERLDESERREKITEAMRTFDMAHGVRAMEMGNVSDGYKLITDLAKLEADLKLKEAETYKAFSVGAGGGAGWKTVIDSVKKDDNGNPVTYRLNERTGETETLDHQPYTPGGPPLHIGTSRQQDVSLPPGWDQGAIDFWTNVIRAGGHLPPGLSRTSGGSAVVQAIMKRAPELSGSDPGKFIANVYTVQADAGSLRNMERMADAATSFERTAERNFDVAMRLSRDVVPTDLGPFFNRWIMEGEKMFGDTNVPPYITALITAANEYAKIMSGSTGAQGSTVDSRREATELFSPYLSSGQIERVVAIAKNDMMNRRQSLYGQVDEIKNRLRAAGSTAPTLEQGQGTPTQVSPTAPTSRYDSQGNRVQ